VQPQALAGLEAERGEAFLNSTTGVFLFIFR